MESKPLYFNEETEGMWVALQSDCDRSDPQYYFYAPTILELKEVCEEHGLTQGTFTYHKLGFYMQTIPEWSREHPNNKVKCECKCGYVHYLDKPDTRDWRKAQNLPTKR